MARIRRMSASQQRSSHQIWEAIEKKDANAIRRIFKNPLSFNLLRHSTGYTVLGYAAYYGAVQAINILLMEGADIHEIGEGDGARMPLSLASYGGHSDAVKCLVDKISDINLTDPDGNTALSNAAKAGHCKIIDQLIVDGADVSKFESKGSTPLCWAVKGRHLDSIQLLVAKGADINQCDYEGNTPLTYAMRIGDGNIIKYFLDKGVEPPQSSRDRNWTDFLQKLVVRGAIGVAIRGAVGVIAPHTLIMPMAKHGIKIAKMYKTSIPSAASKDDIEKIKSLLSNGGDINEVDSNGNTALAISAKNGNSEIVQFLLRKGANVSKFQFPGRPPLTWAAKMGHLEVVKILIKKGANINEVDLEGNTPLTNAILSDKDNTAVIEYLISEGADVCKTNQGKTPLFAAIRKEDLTLVKYLLNNGAKPTIRSALMEAIRIGNLEVIACLLEEGVSINFEDRNGYTPLKMAVEIGNTRIVQFLINSGAIYQDKNHISKHLFKYVKEKNLDMVEFLVKMGVDLQTVDQVGYTPLTRAVKTESFKVVKYLVEQGTELNQVDGNGKTGLTIAAENSSFQIATYLIDSGADINLAKAAVENFARYNQDFDKYLQYR